jgi:hypothetical protein
MLTDKLVLALYGPGTVKTGTVTCFYSRSIYYYDTELLKIVMGPMKYGPITSVPLPCG